MDPGQPRRGPRRRPRGPRDAWRVPAGGWFHLRDAFGPGRFETAVSQPGAAGFTVGMPNFPAVYAIRAGLDYIRRVGVERIAEAGRPLVAACLEGLAALPVELLTPKDEGHLAGILAFRHPAANELHRRLRAQDIHIMGHAGRLRIAIHGYNTRDDIERLLAALRQALSEVGAA